MTLKHRNSFIKTVFVILLVVCVVSAASLLTRLHTSTDRKRMAAQSRIKHTVHTETKIAAPPKRNSKGKIMAVSVPKTSTAVNVLMTTSGTGPGGTSATSGQARIVDSTGSAISIVFSPAPFGGSLTVSGITLTDLGTTTLLSGRLFENYSLSIAPSATIPAGTGYALEQISVSGGSPAYALFDIPGALRSGYSYFTPTSLANDHQPDAWIVGNPDTSGWLYDGSAGDTATGYSAASYLESGVYYSTLYTMLYSVVPFAPASASFTYLVSGTLTAANLSLYCQNNTGSHTEYSSASPATGTITPVLAAQSSSNWHWRLSAKWAGAPGTLTITDMRFLDGGSGEIIPVTGAVVGDLGAGVDTATINATLNIAESGAGVDTPSVGLLKAFTDSGSGADVASKTIGRTTIAAGTTGTVTSSGSSTIAALPGAWRVDLGGSPIADSFVPSGWLVTYSAGTFTISVPSGTTPTIGHANFLTAYYEGPPGTAPYYAPFDTTPDVVTVKSVSDGGTAADTITFAGRIVSIADSGSGADTSTVIASIGVSDGGVGTESAIGPGQGINVAESGSATDAATVAGITADAAERGVSSETIEINAAGTVYDFAFGQSVATATDISSASATIPVSDFGIGSDLAELVPVIINIAESGTATDTATAPTKGGGPFAERILN